MLGEMTSKLGEEEHSTEAKGCKNDKREGLAEGTGKKFYDYLWILIPNGVLSLKLQNFASARWLG